jgi:hypothetical protein
MVTTLDDRTGITEEARQAEATVLTEKLTKAGAFANQEDDAYAKQAQWMVYCALIVEDICELPQIETCVSSDTEDRDELLHEAMLHFGNMPVAPWNISQEVETAMDDFLPFKLARLNPASVYEGVRQSMARFRGAIEGGEVLGSWLEVWASISRLIAELLLLKAAHATVQVNENGSLEGNS